MSTFRVVAERAPLVWILVGLLFNATGLYLGFDYVQAFWYLMLGCFCFAYGVALGLFRLRERPKVSDDKRLSPKFVSASATQVMKSMASSEHAVVKEQPETANA